MKSSIQDVLLGVLVLTILLVIGYFLLFWLYNVFLSLDKTIQASLIAAFVALFSVLFTFWKERSRAFREAHRDQKIKAYSIFFDFIFEVLHSAKNDLTDEIIQSSDFQDRWMEMSKQLLFYGSSDVLKAFNDFKSGAGEGVDPAEILIKVGRILLAIRDDIGLSNKGLTEINIHQIYIREDIDKVISELSTS